MIKIKLAFDVPVLAKLLYLIYLLTYLLSDFGLSLTSMVACLGLISKTTGFGLGLKNAALEPICSLWR